MELGYDQHTGQSIDLNCYVPKTLASAVARRGKLSVEECIVLGLALSQALAELHKHGLVHRDGKPSNIIFVHGVAKLADTCLVMGVDEANSYVGTGGFIPNKGPGSSYAVVYA